MSHPISALPCEIVQHIMEYLPVKDRKSASLVCRLWHQEVFSSRLQSSVQLHVVSSRGNNRLLEVLRNSFRTYRNLYIRLRECDHHNVRFVEDILSAVGSEVENFTICECSSWNQLESLVIKMPKLKHLKAYVWNTVDYSMEQKRNEPDSIEFPGLAKLLSLNINIGREIVDIPRFQFEQLQVLTIRSFLNKAELSTMFHHVLPVRKLFFRSEITQSLLETVCRSCPLLETLDVAPSVLNRGLFQCLEKLTKLQVLAVRYFRSVMIEECKPLPSVRELQLLATEVNASEFSVDQLCKVFPNLGTIKLSFPTIYFNAAQQRLIRQICGKFTHLKKLTLIGRFSLQIQSNDLGNVEELTLRYLDVSFKPQLTSKLKRLTLEFFDVFKSDISRVGECFPTLRYLEIQDYGHLNQCLLAGIQSSIPDCVINYVCDARPYLWW